jgi:DNA repair exonuclease SbcCD ATPase subunit
MKGFKELIDRIRKEPELDEAAIEQELNKILPESWVPKTTFNEKSTAAKNAETQLAELNKQLEEVKKSAGASEELKRQIADLQAAQEAAKAEYQKELTTTRRNYAIEQALTGAKAKNTRAVRALLDEGKLVIGEDGTIAGLKEQLEAIQKDNGYLFETTEPAGGGKPSFGGSGTPPDTSGAGLLARMEAAAGIRPTADK